MSNWKSAKARRVFAALESIGWRIKRHKGTSHKVLEREGWADYVFSFHDGVEIGPKMLSKIAKKTGLKPEDI
jgi:predicted RNA binding protein YcfA (HicA-like mRNA interferase family)